jgi:valine--pyruvate aminotransferase
VIVVPGSYFFYGLPDDWRHRHQCLRLSYCQPRERVRRGIEILAEEVRRAG